MRLLYHAKDIINPYILKCGGTPIPDEDDDCWYWTSTEVEGQATAKAWLYSLGSGAIQETPKWQPHKARPIITINGLAHIQTSSITRIIIKVQQLKKKKHEKEFVSNVGTWSHAPHVL